MNQNLFSLIRSRITDPHRLVMETPADREYRYADLLALSARFANVLMDLGLKPGDRVAAQVDKSPEAILLYLGVLRAGGVYLPLNTGYTAGELRYFLGDAEPLLFVCRPDKLDEARDVAGDTGVACVESLGSDADGSLMARTLAAASDFPDMPRSDNDLAAILYTSGTTGRSKGAMLSHANLASNAEVLRNYWQFTADDVLLHALPIYHTHGLFVACNTVFLASGGMIFLEKFDADLIIRQLPRATSMMGVPTFYTRLLAREDFTRDLVAHMRLFTSGSAPLTADTHRSFFERTGHAILERYGMTETNMSTSNPYEGERRAGTVGFPLPGVSLRVMDRESGEPLPEGEIGMIEVRGPNVFQGYWRMLEKTREEFRDDGFFITGDVGFIDAEGYVHLVAREKDLIISGGFNVYPKEVESLIDEQPGVVESAVVGVPHSDLGEGVVAVVVTGPGAQLDEATVIGALQDRLARFKQPKQVYFVESLPRNTMGKVQKNLLREQYRGAFE